MKKIIMLLVCLAMVIGSAASASAGEPVFSDIPAGHWAQEPAERAFKEGVIQGTYYNQETGERHFAPEKELTYAQFVTIMLRSEFPEKLKAREDAGMAWDLAAQTVAEELGLIRTGLDRKTLNSPMPRNDMAMLLVNLLYATGRTAEESFDLDAIVSEIKDGAVLKNDYRNYVAICYDLGLISGYGDGSFKGDRNMTRGQGATVYCRYADLDEMPVPRHPSAEYLGVSGQEPENGGQTGSQEDGGTTALTKEDEFIAGILGLVNQERAKAGAPALKLNEGLQKAAMLRAKELTELFDHTRPDGTACDTAIDSATYSKLTKVGENIAAGQYGAEAVMDSWMNSPGHRANILDPDFTHIGIGVYITGSGYGYHYTQLFGAGNLSSMDAPQIGSAAETGSGSENPQNPGTLAEIDGFRISIDNNALKHMTYLGESSGKDRFALEMNRGESLDVFREGFYRATKIESGGGQYMYYSLSHTHNGVISTDNNMIEATGSGSAVLNVGFFVGHGPDAMQEARRAEIQITVK